MANAANLLLEMVMLGAGASGDLPWIGQVAQQTNPAETEFQELVARLLGEQPEDARANELQAGQQVLEKKHEPKKAKPEQGLAEMMVQSDYLLRSAGTSAEMPQAESPDYVAVPTQALQHNVVVPTQALQPPAEDSIPLKDVALGKLERLPLNENEMPRHSEVAAHSTKDGVQSAQQEDAAIPLTLREVAAADDAPEPVAHMIVETPKKLPAKQEAAAVEPNEVQKLGVSAPKENPVKPRPEVPDNPRAAVVERDLPAAMRVADPVQRAKVVWDGIVGQVSTRGEVTMARDAPVRQMAPARPWVFTPIVRDVAVPQSGFAEFSEIAAPDLLPIERADVGGDSLSDRPAPENLWMPLTTEVKVPGANAVLHASASNGKLPPEQVISTRIISQIVRSAKVNLTESGGEMSLRLDPPHLGLVRMNVTAVDGTVTATIQTSTETAKQVLSADVSVLKQALLDAGVRVDSIDVSVGADLNQNWSAHTNGHGGPAWGEPRGNSYSAPRFLGRDTGQDSTYSTRSNSIGGFDYLA